MNDSSLSEEYAALRQRALQTFANIKNASSSLSSAFAKFQSNSNIHQILHPLATVQDIDDFKDQLVENSVVIKDFLRSCVNQESELETISKSFDDMLLQTNNLQREIATKNGTLAILEKQIADQNIKISNLESKVKTKEENITILRNELKDHRTNEKSLEKEIERLRREIQSRDDRSLTTRATGFLQDAVMSRKPATSSHIPASHPSPHANTSFEQSRNPDPELSLSEILRGSRGVKRLPSEVVSDWGIWIKNGEYKPFAEAPLTGEASTAFETEFEKTRFCQLSNEDYNKAMVVRDMRKDAFCMWSRVFKEKNEGNPGEVACSTCIQNGRFCFTMLRNHFDSKPVLLPLPEDRRTGMSITDAGFWRVAGGTEVANTPSIKSTRSTRTFASKRTAEQAFGGGDAAADAGVVFESDLSSPLPESQPQGWNDPPMGGKNKNKSSGSVTSTVRRKFGTMLSRMTPGGQDTSSNETLTVPQDTTPSQGSLSKSISGVLSLRSRHSRAQPLSVQGDFFQSSDPAESQTSARQTE